MTMSHPKLLFGAAGFGVEFVSTEAVREILETLSALGITEIDTAARYPPTDMGASERLLGATKAASLGFQIDTKVLITGRDTSGTLEADKIATSLQTSHKSLQLSHNQKIRVLYAHAPHPTTPIRDQAAAFDAEFRDGHFEKVGVRTRCHAISYSLTSMSFPS